MSEQSPLGLKHGSVELVEHNPRWLDAYLQEKATLSRILESLDCQIEHVGSTAVPELPAKPILDVAVGMSEASEVDEVIRRLEAEGQAVRTAVINKRAGGAGLIVGRKSFQRPRKQGIELLNAVQDVYLDDEVQVA